MRYDMSVEEASGFVLDVWNDLEKKHPGIKFAPDGSPTDGSLRLGYKRLTGAVDIKKALIKIGTEEFNLAHNKDVYIADVNVVAAVQQSFHELQHYIQYKDIMSGKVHNDMAETMAMQSWLSNVFPTLYSANYTNMLVEIDAQRASLEGTREYFQTRHPDMFDVDKCLAFAVNRRTLWCGKRPICVDGVFAKTMAEAVDNAITDLQNKYNQAPACIFPIDNYDNYTGRPDVNYEYEKQFMESDILKETYKALSQEDGMNFLFDYACAYGPKLIRKYPILKDRYLKWSDRGQFRKRYLNDDNLKHMIFHDENQYTEDTNSRGSMAEDKFGFIVEAASKNHDGHGGLGE